MSASRGAVRGAMTMRATIERNATTATDDFGQPAADSYATYGNAIACNVWSKGKRDWNDAGKNVFIEDWRAKMPLGTDVTEKDRISAVKDRNGTTVYSGTLVIDTIQTKRTHLLLMLRKVS